MEIKENIPLRNWTTFKIGGPARYFAEVKSKEELIEGLKFARQEKLAFFILGGGSNLLVADEGFFGLVIKMENKGFKIKNSEIYAEAGTALDDLIKLAAKNSLTGIEWASGIPRATVGGALYNNAGAFENSMADIVKEVEVFDMADSKVKKLNKKDCRFGYKETIFKRNRKLVILAGWLTMRKDNPARIKERIDYVLNYREKNHPMNLPSAGSIFKNPKNMPVSAGKLIAKAGLKGRRIGAAQISPKHANFIVNLGGASSKDVLRLIDLIKKEITKRFGIDLAEEVQYLST